jgi:hypothetical protein
MTNLMQQYQVPGAALAVVRDGRLVFAFLEHRSGWYNEADRTGSDPVLDLGIALAMGTPPPADWSHDDPLDCSP